MSSFQIAPRHAASSTNVLVLLVFLEHGMATYNCPSEIQAFKTLQYVWVSAAMIYVVIRSGNLST